MKACPFCAEHIQDGAIKCRFCGAEVPPVGIAPAVKRGSPFLRIIGGLLFLGGLFVAVYYFAAFDTSVPVPETQILGQTIGGGRVNNIGLMNEQHNGIIMGGGAAVFGFVLVLLGERSKR